MKHFKLAFIAAICFFPAWLGAKQVSPETARQVAEAQVRSLNQLRSAQELNLVYTETTGSKTVSGAPAKVSGNTSADVLYYVFNAGDRGFVIVSGDDIAVPVLGYSDNGAYDPANLPPDFVYYMNCLADEIKEGIAKNFTQSEKSKEQWEVYIMGNVSSLRAATAVSPILTTKWNQGTPYNDNCPLIGSDRTVTGCVATAMAQIMKRHNHPATRTVTIPAYTTKTKGLSIPAFAGTTYNWASMTDTYNTSSSSASKTAVATLMYHCGAGAKMDYNIAAVGGSGAITTDAALALVTYFDYDQSLRYLQRAYYSNNDWETLLRNEIDAARPVFYTGSNPSSGHAFVCDGYDNTGKFHFNWGWGGYQDGYFVTTSLNPGGGGTGAGAGTYNQDQGILINIKPNAGGVKSDDIKIIPQFHISASKTTLDRGESFTVNAPVKNMGLFDFTGNVGIAIVDNSDNILHVIGQESINLPPGYYFPSPFNIDCTIPAAFTPGDCRIRVVYKSTDASQWSIATGTPGYTDVLNLTITDTLPRTYGIKIVNGSNLTSSVSSVNRGATFTVSARYVNKGTTTAIGDYGIALVDNNDQILEIIGVSYTNVSIEPGYSFNNPFDAICGISSAITPGNYKLRAVFRPAGENWSIIYAEASNIDILSLTVNATILPDDSDVRMAMDFVVSSNPVNQFSPLSIQTRVFNLSSAATSFVGILELGLYDSAGILQEVIGTENAVLPNNYRGYYFTFNTSSVNLPGGIYYLSLYQKGTDSAKKKVAANGYNNNLPITVIGVSPNVISVSPANGATDVPLSGQLIITFDKAMNTASGTGVVTLGGGVVSDEYKTWSSDNKVCTIPYLGLAYSSNYTFNISEFKDASGNVMNAVTSGYSFQTVAAPPATTWNPQNGSTNWSDNANWTDGVPGTITKVTIPGDVLSFPVLEESDNANAAEIHFAPGAQIGNQSLLTYTKAFVGYDFNNTDKRERWLMLSIALKEVYPGDFVFGGYPLTWLRTFASTGGGSTAKGSWVNIRGSRDAFSFGDGFVLWLNKDGGANDKSDKGLKLLENCIFELPYFQYLTAPSPEYDRYHAVNLAQDYNESNNTSTLYNFSIQDGEYKRLAGSSYEITRNTTAGYQLAGSEVVKTINFEDGIFALTGNPYMASLDFDKLQAGNVNAIKPNYQVWTGSGYSAYSSFGSSGEISDNTLDQYISPLQGFIVEKSGSASTNQLVFNEDMSTAVSGTQLRSSVSNENRITLEAWTPKTGVRAIIAKSERGQDEFGDMDVRKIINSISEVPEIYTLKPYKGSLIAVGVNVINNDDLLIPTGLTTSYSGDIKLSFSGMDTYGAKISFIDSELNKEIDLTGLASCDYVVNYTPATVDGQAAACENRFFLRISKTATGLKETMVERVNVYEGNGLIHAVSGTFNPIREVLVYNQQGALIYRKSAINMISHTVDRNLSSGVYIVKVISEKNVDNVKVIVR